MNYLDFVPSQMPKAMGGNAFPIAGSFMDQDKVNTLKELLRDPLLDPDSQREAQRRLMEMTKGGVFTERV